VQKLANAIRQVKVQRITLDIVEAPEVLVQAIPHSLVREWDFLATTALGAKGSTVFPDADEVKSLATAPNPLCSGNGQLVSLSTSQKNTLRRIALNYQFDPSESVKAVARATLDLLRE